MGDDLSRITKKIKNTTADEKRFLILHGIGAFVMLGFFVLILLLKNHDQPVDALVLLLLGLFAANLFFTVRFWSHNVETRETHLMEEITDLLEKVPSPFLILSGHEITYMNQAMKEIVGAENAMNALHQDYTNYVAAEFQQATADWLSGIRSAHSREELELKLVSSTKTGLWISMKGAVIGTNTTADLLISAFDISARKRNELMLKKLGDLKDQIILLADSIQHHDNIIPLLEHILDISLSKINNSLFGSFLVLEGNEYFRIAVYRGFPPEEITGALIPIDQSFAYLASGGNIRKTVIISDIKNLPNIENNLRSFTNTITWELRSTLSTPIFVHGKLYGTINIDSQHPNAFTEEDALLMEFFKENVEKAIEKAEELIELKSKSYTDFLTGLHNRAFFEETLNEAVSQYDPEKPFCIVMIDLDYLKSVNDRFGHTGGDLLLKHFANGMSIYLPSETVICRHGGDEFSLFFPDSTETQVSEIMKNMTLELSRQKLKFGDDHLPIRFSYGIAEHNAGCRSAMSLLELADSKMYEMKWLHKKEAMENSDNNQCMEENE